VQRDWGFGGLTGVKSQWSVAGREAPGRPGGFVSSCLPLASNGSSLEQGLFRAVDWLMSCGVRINDRGSNSGGRTLEPTHAITVDGKALVERGRYDVTGLCMFERVNCFARLLMNSLFPCVPYRPSAHHITLITASKNTQSTPAKSSVSG
jgi:hypothetical protein